MIQPKYKVGDDVIIVRRYLPHTTGVVASVRTDMRTPRYCLMVEDPTHMKWYTFEAEMVCRAPVLESPPSDVGDNK